MQEWEEKILEKRKARAEGLAEGRAEGRAEGETFRLIQLIKRKSRNQNLSFKLLTNWKKNLTTFNHFTNAFRRILI